jgi:hypothetical protein
MSEHDSERNWGHYTGRADEEPPDVEAHASKCPGQDEESTEPDAQSAEHKAERRHDDEGADVEAHWSRYTG